MKKQDLLVSMTIENHRIATRFLYLAKYGSIQDDHVMMGKDAKGKGKTRAKRDKGENCSAEEQEVKKSTDKPRALLAFGKDFFLICLTKWNFFFLLWAGVFSFSLPKDFFLLLIFPQD